jgi:hypothetical protein
VWSVLAPTYVALLLDDRAPRPGVVKVVADVDGSLARALGAARGMILLVRPDRFVAAVLPADLARVAGSVAQALAVRVASDAGRESGHVPAAPGAVAHQGHAVDGRGETLQTER